MSPARGDLSPEEADKAGSGCLVIVVWVVAVVLALVLLVVGAWPVAPVVVVGALVATALIGRRGARIAAEREAAEAKERAERSAWVATLPRDSVRLGSSGRVGVAGEWFRLDAVKRVVAGRKLAPVGQWDRGLPSMAYLVREPANPHDRNAVAVLMDTADAREHVGYLRAELAPRWQPTLRALEARGQLGAVRAMIYAGNRDGIEVVLHLSEPEDALFGNAQPLGALPLVPERQCAVSGEKDYQTVLARLPLGRAWATLHAAEVSNGKYKGEATIEVRLDGSKVGALTAAQGKRYAEVLGYAPLVCCEATVFEGTRYRELQVYLPRVD